MLKKFPSDKINGTKNAFLSRGPTHHSFTFNLGFLYELKRKVRLSKKFNDLCMSWSCPETDLVTTFLNLQKRSFDTVSFSQ